MAVALAAAGFSTYALLYCVQPLLPVFSDDLGVSPSLSSLSLSATTATLAVAMLFAGRLSDVTGRKAPMAVSLFAVGLLTVVAAFAPNWGSLLAMRALTGVAMAGVPSVAMAYLAEEVHPRDLGVAMGIYIAGNAYGGMAGRVLTGAIIEVTDSWRLTLGFIGALGLVAAVLFMALLPPSRRFKPEQGLSLGHLTRAFALHLRDGDLLALFGVGFLIMGALVATYNYLSYRLLEPPFGLSQAVSGAIFLVYILGAPASAWFGRLGGRHGRGRMLAVALGLMAAGLSLTASGNLPVTIVGITVLTCGFFGSHSIASSWVSRRAVVARAQAASLYLFAYYAGSSLFGSLGGLFWSRFRWPGIMGLVATLLAAALGLALWLHGREQREAVPRETP